MSISLFARYKSTAQSNIICLGSESFTAVFTSILDAYRPTLQKNDPLFIGDGDPLGVIDLRRGRVHGLNGTYFRDTLTATCNESHMDMFFPLKVERPRIVYDVRQAMRELPLRGELHITMDLIDLDIGLQAAKKKGKSRPLVDHLDISRLEGFGLTFRRMGLLGEILNVAVETAHSLYGQPLEDFFEILLWRALQRYADNNPLPI
ncbi:hypothetical protein HPB50_011914 [Hyalomma asiaticum]|uniref:Uncharacterized protein n=1 Tax=Hyalomma asiaticum TaxID=266040 RepID=A0ACB7SVE1_HYAAI|nr:hypothetical protein HPB50_011914 [Hyalomma asiaticum]